ncbi:hypothetical protein L3Q82_010101 [Scortum barcoo]|uniref:Uncharacterized protein n=1 Tax=Scortum barcoo TaxID=214431 RepID=A0ACB8WAK3_9TELE|nr:hypothetical protein L3Q82_010101 [Scortum barcoo]
MVSHLGECKSRRCRQNSSTAAQLPDSSRLQLTHTLVSIPPSLSQLFSCSLLQLRDVSGPRVVPPTEILCGGGPVVIHAYPSHFFPHYAKLTHGSDRRSVAPHMDTLQFAYQPNVSVDDALIYMLHRTYTHLDTPDASGHNRILLIRPSKRLIGAYLGIDLKNQCAYHPASGGAVERENGTLKAKLAKTCEDTGLHGPFQILLTTHTAVKVAE